jgi:hypothetical protein
LSPRKPFPAMTFVPSWNHARQQLFFLEGFIIKRLGLSGEYS